MSLFDRVGHSFYGGSGICLVWPTVPIKALVIRIGTVFEGFAYPCETWYADFAWIYGTPHLKALYGYHRLMDKVNPSIFA